MFFSILSEVQLFTMLASGNWNITAGEGQVEEKVVVFKSHKAALALVNTVPLRYRNVGLHHTLCYSLSTF